MSSGAAAQEVALFQDSAFQVGNEWLYRLVDEEDGRETFTRDEPARIVGTEEIRGNTALLYETSFETFYRDTQQLVLAPEGLRRLGEISRDLDDDETETFELNDDNGPGWLFIPRQAALGTSDQQIADGTGRAIFPEGTFDIEGTTNLTVEGQETITVPAGTFATTRLRLVTDLRSEDANARELTTHTIWLHPQIGIIRDIRFAEFFEDGEEGFDRATRDLISTNISTAQTDAIVNAILAKQPAALDPNNDGVLDAADVVAE